MASIADQLDDARQELLDLTLRNPLISYRLLKSRGLDIIDERPAEVYRILVEDGRKMSFLPLSDEQQEQLEEVEDGQYDFGFAQPDEEDNTEEEDGLADRHVDTKLQTPHSSSRLQGRLLKTFYHARRSIEEEGVNTLYLALGDLHWYRSESAEKERRAPLLLLPVELDRTSVQGRFRIQYTGEEIGGNISLEAYMESEFGLDLPMPPDPSDEDENELDIRRYFNRVSQAIQHQDRWYVNEHGLMLGFFSFTRFLMYEDLDISNWPEGRQPDNHPVIEDLLEDGFPPPEGRIGDDEHLDQYLDPKETYHIVEADSSQTQALLDIERGFNLVLQGPPGTGKSQTITNVIAEAIGQDKTVLFVSEKMAALEVVKRKLDTHGLGDACLELHSHKTRKKTVLNELERTLDLGPPQVEDFSQKALVLEDARSDLNAYAEAVNRPVGQTDVRPYQAYGKLLRLRRALTEVSPPDLKVDGMSQWTDAEYKKRQYLIEQIESHLAVMGPPAKHPFWGSQKDRFLPAHQEDIEEAAENARQATTGLKDEAARLADLTVLSAPDDVDEVSTLIRAARVFLDAPQLEGIAVTDNRWTAQAETIQELVDEGLRYQEIGEEYEELLIPEAWDQDLVETRQHLAAHGEKWYRWLIGDWRAAKSRLAGLCQGPMPSDPDRRVEVVDAILEAQRLKSAIEEQDGLGTALFGPGWQGPSSRWEHLDQVTSFLTDLHQEIATSALPESLLDTLEDPPSEEQVSDQLEVVIEAKEEFERAVSGFAEEIKLDETRRFGGEERLLDQPFEELIRVFEACSEHVARIQEIVTYNQLEEDLRNQSLEPIAEAIPGWEGGPEHLTEAFDRAYYGALLERAMDDRKALDRFSGAQHEQIAERFRQLDEEALEHNRHELALKHFEGMPVRHGTGQMGVLMSEFGKKRRHMPIRRLMEKAGNPIQALKPVFMMSPMSVPKYLPPKSVDFDLVVFDEASQVKPVDAFGSILRGDQTVVVGDSKQLPPTSFFESVQERTDEDFEMHVGDQESILDLFRSKGAPERMLRFHYRSKHPSLIAVSNKEFYENDLFVFPSPDAEREETGLIFHHLPETTYDRGGSRKNRGEARTVAEHVMDHARNRSNQTLGVATFSSAQQEAIRNHLEQMRREDPSCEGFFKDHPEEPFFVKNLESVQGDQRDVIYISVGYGRDESGHVKMNFGPLNNEGGHRRLNVLTTRAKYRCEVFSNITGDHIDLSRTKARGVQVLKEYLDYAKTGELKLEAPSGREPDSPFEIEVARAIENHGYEVEHQIGSEGFYIDLAVVDPEKPGQYILGIECDGATYHSSRTARDRDRIREMVLVDQGWTIHRIWSTDWFRNPEDELAKVLAAIKKAETGTHANSDGADPKAPTGERGTDEEETEQNDSDEPAEPSTTIDRAETTTKESDLTEPYNPADIEVVLTEPFHEESNTRVGRWIRDVVRAEGPVHQEVVGRRVLNAAGISRMGRRIKRKLKEGIRYAAQQGWIERNSEILRTPDGEEDPPIRDRSEAEVARDIDLIPEGEIAAAAEQIVSRSYGVGKDELVQQVSRVLGFARLGSTIEERIGQVVDQMVETGRLTRENDELIASSSS